MKREKLTEQERQAFNAALAKSQKDGIIVKLLDGKGFYIFGALGTGMGAWSRAAKVAKTCSLDSLPQSLRQEEWDELEGEIRVIPWPK